MDDTALQALLVGLAVGLALGGLLGTLLGVSLGARRRASDAAAERRHLEDSVEPVRRDLAQLHVLLAESRTVEAAAGESLRRQVADDLRRVGELVQKIGSDTRGLQVALLGNVNLRGQWGEAVLEQMLKNSGLVRGVHYETQVTLHDAAGRPDQRPDLVVRLPDGSAVVIDGKAVFPDYARFASATTPEARRTALRAHLHALRTTMRDLASRHYERRVEGSIEFVLLFLPLEGAYQAAITEDASLLTDAMAHNVLPVGPSSLIAMLTLIQRIWRRSEQERNTERILAAARDLAERTIAFGGELETLGEELERASRAYADALRRLRGPRGVAASLATLADLHVRPSHPLPSPLAHP